MLEPPTVPAVAGIVGGDGCRAVTSAVKAGVATCLGLDG
uniref:Uncharacterized protein n=1 Tax=uncultured prokaryote TaxID=198431 RepID=A0A0H5PYG2_9ZZZZ|nr:hypothetical protein [uncultured prokaryote]